MPADFVHLHTHTCYSLLDGECHIDRLISHAKSLGQSALAITDHGVMYGVAEFYKEAKKQGIKPVLGCEVYVAARSLHDKVYEYDAKRSHLILLAENNTGYKNLMKLVSIANTDGFYIKPRIDKVTLREYSEGLICLSACLAGEIPNAILNDDLDTARLLIEEYISIFGKENFFLEIQDHGTMEDKKVNSRLVTFANEYGLELVATNDVHYIHKRDAEFQDILMCIQTGKTIYDKDRMKFDSDEFYLKSGEEMAELFPTLPSAIENTVKIAERCNVELEFGTYHLPQYPMDGIDKQPFDYLKELCYAGLEQRYTVTPELTERLEYELKTISDMGFVDYFLIVWDFIKYAKDNDIMVGPGRGSAAGSLVAYCLNITEIDPIQYGLIFERFLNPERITMPDIDIDFCIRRRGEVLNYVTEKYGRDKVAQIITFGTLAARSVVRDVGRALNIPYGDVDTVAKMIPFKLGQTIDNALKEPALKARYESDPQTKKLIDCAKELEGLPRHASTHAAGVVITKNTLSDYVPLQYTDENLVTQFTMTTLEELGLLKMDFLGLRNLTIIRDALDQVGSGITVEDISKDDPKAYKLIANGDTDGIFQLESAGMKAFMRELKPTTMEDIVAGISLYRPGPSDSIPRYVANKNNPDKVTYKHPLLEPILKSTYGCIVYQEQVMQIVQTLAGYPLGRADLLRRAMGKKKPEVILKEKNSFLYGDEEVDGVIKRGVPEEVGKQIFDEMADFGKYAFNKSHAAAYAMVAYQTAYLKAHYPVQFMCALMSSQMYDTAKLTHYINDLASMGIRLSPPDIQSSRAAFTEKDGKILFGLAAVKNVGKGLVDEITAERENGPFLSLTDFCTRMNGKGMNKRALESLIRAGAFDSLGGKRSQYLSVFSDIMDQCQSQSRYGFSGQLSLLDEEDAADDNLPPMQEFAKDDLLAMEKEVIGIFVSGHPLDKYKDILQKNAGTEIAELLAELSGEDAEQHDGEEIRITGIITQKRVKITKNDTQMAFLRVEDLSGMIEVLVFPKLYKSFETLLEEERVVSITGRIDMKENETPKVILQRVREVTASAGKLYIKIPPGGGEKLPMLKELLKIYHGDTPVLLYYMETKQYFAAQRDLYAAPCQALEQKILTLLGDGAEVVVK